MPRKIATSTPVVDAPAPDADVTPDAPDAPDADVTPEGEGTPVTPEDAPDAPEAPDTGMTVTQIPAVLTPAQKRAAKARKQAEKQQKKDRYKLADDCEWVIVPSGGRAAVCESTPNADGETFLYVVFENRGRQLAMPLTAIDVLQEVGQV